MTFLMKDFKGPDLCRRRKGHKQEELEDEGGVHGLDEIERCSTVAFKLTAN